MSGMVPFIAFRVTPPLPVPRLSVPPRRPDRPAPPARPGPAAPRPVERLHPQHRVTGATGVGPGAQADNAGAQRPPSGGPTGGRVEPCGLDVTVPHANAPRWQRVGLECFGQVARRVRRAEPDLERRRIRVRCDRRARGVRSASRQEPAGGEPVWPRHALSARAPACRADGCDLPASAARGCAAECREDPRDRCRGWRSNPPRQPERARLRG